MARSGRCRSVATVGQGPNVTRHLRESSALVPGCDQSWAIDEQPRTGDVLWTEPQSWRGSAEHAFGRDVTNYGFQGATILRLREQDHPDILQIIAIAQGLFDPQYEKSGR